MLSIRQGRIVLDVLVSEISADDWARAYDASLRVVREHPLGVVRSGRRRAVLGGEEQVWRLNLQACSVGDGGVYWSVEGDRWSGESAEAFTLYRDPAQYGARCLGTGGDGDVLHGLGVGSSRVCRVWSGATNNAPYTEVVLAAGVALEHILGCAVVMRADVGLDALEKARRWVGCVLGEPVRMPVWARPWDVVRRLSERFRGESLCWAWERMLEWDERGTLHTVARRILGEERHSVWLGEVLQEGKGWERHCVGWVDAGGSVEMLLEVACWGEGRLDPCSVLRSLVRGSVTLFGPGRALCEGVEEAGVSAVSVGLLALSCTRVLGGGWTEWVEVIERLERERRVELVGRVRSVGSELRWVGVLFAFAMCGAEEGEMQGDVFGEVWGLVRAVEGVYEERLQGVRGWSVGDVRALVHRRAAECGCVVSEDAWGWVDVEEDREVLWWLVACFEVVWGELGLVGALRRVMLENRGVCLRLWGMSVGFGGGLRSPLQ